MLDDQNNATLRRFLLNNLATEGGAHVLFGGHTTGTEDLANVAAKHGLPALTPSSAPDASFRGYVALRGVGHQPPSPPGVLSASSAMRTFAFNAH